ncbi:Wadjet anti-phage system protein JetD domain-containing protein [Dactylosporangium sp. CS-047395]|uniref:Wadjet anti-phage system protein JetD domain-containing protein n=1 Tax=Dactylosporangium sp. CS-047395 TaxID=3239936 RepID=UPI003D91DEC7
MRDASTVLPQIRARYRNKWRDWLLRDSEAACSFSLDAPSAQTIARDSAVVGRWVRAWRDWSRAHPTAQLRTATRQTVVGTQEVPTHLDLTTVEDLVALDRDLSSHWSTASVRWTLLKALPRGASAARLRPHLQQIVDLEPADFKILIDAAVWFTEHPRSGLTIRQVPVVGMHTKWLARHRWLVLACLNLTPRSDFGTEQLEEDLDQDDLDPLGLVSLPAHVDVILVDPADRALVGGLRHVSAPLPEIDVLPVRPRTVLIVENKESAYLIPDQTRTVIIHSLGNHLNVLSNIGWLSGARHLYWGDLDRAGLTLLSRARTQLPGLVSVLMDPVTLEEHKALAVGDETRADTPEPNLTDAEAASLAAISTDNGTYLRLEQERLPAWFVLERLKWTLDGVAQE